MKRFDSTPMHVSCAFEYNLRQDCMVSSQYPLIPFRLMSLGHLSSG